MSDRNRKQNPSAAPLSESVREDVSKDKATNDYWYLQLRVAPPQLYRNTLTVS